MNIYAIDKLMSETRRLATEYHRETGQVLPLSNEISRYDVEKILGFTPPTVAESGVDLIGINKYAGKKFQIKSRVIFKNSKSRPKVGNIDFKGKWDFMILVIMNDHYMPIEMHLASKVQLFSEYQNVTKSSERNNMSINKFKVLGELIWEQQGEC